MISAFSILLAERTGLEPATPGVTGRYSNQLNYRSTQTRADFVSLFFCSIELIWRLAMPYSHMGKPHTTIGVITFHY